MKTIVLTEELINRCRTERGGFTSETAKALGVEFPLVQGWTFRLRGKVISELSYQIAYEARVKRKHEPWMNKTPGQLGLGF